MIGAAAIVLALSTMLAIFALRLNADLFYTPTKLAELGGPEAGMKGKVGGFVQPGSLTYGDGAEMEFLVVDEGPESIAVRYSGITPDLFREGSGVVATGQFGADGVFEATTLLAKHDENYVPRELRDMQAPQT